MTPPFLSIVIPAHNEESRLPRTLGQIFAYLEKQTYSSEVIIVENGSTDRTLEIARGFTAQYPSLRVLQEAGSGKGNALQRGVLEANGEYRFICDADLSMPIEELQKFLPPALENFDIAIASREAPGAVRFNEPPYRHWGGRGINLVIRLLILPGMNDTQCGFKCFRAEAAEKLFSQQTLKGWSFDLELLYIARRKKMRVKEIPIHWYFDADSKVNAIRDALRMIGDIFRIHLNAIRGRYDLKP
ncbi:MAG: glycosyltransferase family 2 protein [Anaerolineales bacterium]|nr:glycosyltransferase family 2 protein [Anaerolineales bacterium]MBP6209846.1 glycosyltransferase family 2 protein [Anaerolineales bacterium]